MILTRPPVSGSPCRMKSLRLLTITLFGAGFSMPAAAVVTVIDDLDAGYSTAGSWTSQGIAGRYDGGTGADWQYQNAAGGADTATWNFTGLANGKYLLAATTFTQANLSTSANN